MNIGQDSFPLEFNMAGSPVVLVLDSVMNGFPSNSSFRQVEITVSVARVDTGGVGSFVFLVDAVSDRLCIDIASALRSMLFDIAYDYGWMERETVVYPSLTFKVECREKYMVDGNILFGETNTFMTGSRAVPGRVSEVDRLRLTSSIADSYGSLRFTTKPKSDMEIVPLGEYVATYSIGAEGGVVGTSRHMNTEGLHTLSDGRKVYVVPDDGAIFPLRFVNSMGVLDTATAICKEALSYNIQTESYSVTKHPDNLIPSGMDALKSGGRGKLSLSSGFVSRQWADWWTEEVMRATKCWIRYGSRYVKNGDELSLAPMWVPCIITPKDDEVVVYDRRSQSVCYVEFEAEICNEGSLLRGLLD